MEPVAFVIIIQDRHADTDAEVWSDEQRAIVRARLLAKTYCRHPEDYEEKQIADWVFHASYSCEGDSVTVLRKKIQ
jgi:hypothetical protein